jgi:hypothetical protein
MKQYWYNIIEYVYTFSHLKRPIYGIKMCKVNSRNYTYDGPTFSIESAMVKDALVIYYTPLYETHLFVFGTHS